MMPLVALGMVRRGSSVSPAVTPMSSVPPKLNITTHSAMSRPVHWPSAVCCITPCGKNPPSSVNQLANDAAMPDSVGNANAITAKPPRIIAMTAAILMMANQNSNSPKRLTPSRLIEVMSTRKNAADTHCGMNGNQ